MTMLTGVPDIEAVRSRWTWLVGAGVVFLVVGLIALGNVVSATLVTAVIVGWVLVIAGIAQLVGAFAAGGSTGARVLSGLVAVVYLWVGLNVVAEPLKGVILLTIVISVSMLVEGVVRLVGAFAGQPGHRILLFVTGILDVVLGLWLFTGIPLTGLAIGFFLGLDLIMAGVTWIAFGWGVRQLPAGAAEPA